MVPPKNTPDTKQPSKAKQTPATTTASSTTKVKTEKDAKSNTIPSYTNTSTQTQTGNTATSTAPVTKAAATTAAGSNANTPAPPPTTTSNSTPSIGNSSNSTGSQGKPNQMSQGDINRFVLDYLSKRGYHQTEATLRLESTRYPGAPTQPVSTQNYAFNKPTVITSDKSNLPSQLQRFNDQQKQLKQKQYDEDPKIFSRAYSMYRSWAETSLEMYKYELEKFLYPIFIHCYLTLIQRNEISEARQFYEKYYNDHLISNDFAIRSLGSISLPDHLTENEVAKIFRENKYKLNCSKISMNLILSFLNEHEGIGGGVIVRIINNNMQIFTTNEITTTQAISYDDDENDQTQTFDEGIPAIYELITNNNKSDQNASKSSTETSIDALNSKPVKLGQFPQDPEFVKELEAEIKQKDEHQKEMNGGEKPPGTKTLLEEFKENLKQSETSEDSPSRDVLPLPQKTAYDIKREIMKIQDSRSRIKLSATQAALPSVCMYTFHNTNNDLTTLEFNDDSTIVAGGFQDSFIKLWSIDGSPLKSVLKNDIYNETIDGIATHGCRRLVGHSGAVYGLDFSPENHYLLSSSEDKTVRLWSMDTYSSLVSYKGHNGPVWDVKFSPFGHYFATASHDQTAKLWSCDHIYPLRIFAGHLNDVDCVEFHPNSTYLFTGSSDKTVRMWDIAKGESVRVFLGHSMPVNAMAVSPDGRWLATGGEDSIINVYDIASGRKLKTMRGHGKSSIYSLSFSKEGNVLVSGGSDCSVRVWDIKKGTADSNPQPEPFTLNSVLQARNEVNQANDSNGESKSNTVANGSANSNTTNNGSASAGSNTNTSTTNNKDDNTKRKRDVIATQDHMAVYFTKKTPVYKVHFTRRNLCLAAGVFTP
ncbi:hypothetical protein B5S31_g509 [[Candida] boidinii]|nr:hypothetical protein B5S31_g509 [[Candida] boidinii]